MSILELDRTASRQLGLVTTAQLQQLGLSHRQKERLVSAGALIRVRFLVYRLAGAPVSWEQTVLAATLGAPPSAVASHTTAAALWHLHHCDRRPSGIHITADRVVRIKGVTGHVARLAADERSLLRGIPVTSAERTIIDLSGAMTPKELAESVDDALRRGLVHLERLRRDTDAVASVSSKAGRDRLAPMQLVLAERITGYRPDDSAFETRMNAAWDRLNLPPCERQYRVPCGAKTYRLDRALVATKIGVEWDSAAYHGTWSGIDNDSDRRADLTAEGWVILGFTQNSRPERIARAVYRLWRDRGGDQPEVAQCG